MTDRIEFNYLCFYDRKEHLVKAASTYEAQKIAIKHFKPPKNKSHMVHVYLVKKETNDLQHGNSGYSLQV